ncbi:MAG: AlbA family DNA-binding domain-containing protein [Thermoleophilia bacterium]
MLHLLQGQLDTARIVAFIAERFPEGRAIEYKQSLPSNTDGDKKEFLADVSSFANTRGGVLLYGISAERDQEGKATGLPEEAVGCSGNADADILRLQNLIRSGIGPRIPGVHFQAIPGFPDGAVLVAHIPESWARPHMVTLGGSSRFFARTSNGKYQLDVHEIRGAFLASERLEDRIREFRAGRIADIVGESFAPLRPGFLGVMHVVPIGFVDLDVPLSEAVHGVIRSNLEPSGSVNSRLRYNLDGVFLFSEPDNAGAVRSYVQLFRRGQVESVCSYEARVEAQGGQAPGIAASVVEHDFIAAARRHMAALVALGITGPFVVFTSLLGVGGHMITLTPFSKAFERHLRSPDRVQTIGRAFFVDRDLLLLPEVLTAEGEDPAEFLRPVFDAMWQAAGYARSFDYDDAGRFDP